jgi:predicted Zn-dependent protease
LQKAVSAQRWRSGQAVELDPRNEAARQTYVSLLLENRRTDDAIRQLRLALASIRASRAWPWCWRACNWKAAIPRWTRC